jgi:hypothetical protein
LLLEKESHARLWWLTPVILAINEAEIRKIVVQGHLGQKARFSKIHNTKKAEWLKCRAPA